MLIEIGHYFLAFSTLLIITQSSFFLALCVVTLTLSLFCLFIGYGCSDFSVMNVFVNSNHQLPVFYKISGAWSNHEGSMLLWAWILSLFCILSLIRSRLSAQAIRIKPQWIFKAILFYFCLFLLATSNPYLRISLVSPEAMAELNPVLQDPILAIHPPLIYAGYVASAIGFAVCLSICIQSYTTDSHFRILSGLKKRISTKGQAGYDSPDLSGARCMPNREQQQALGVLQKALLRWVGYSPFWYQPLLRSIPFWEVLRGAKGGTIVPHFAALPKGSGAKRGTSTAGAVAPPNEIKKNGWSRRPGGTRAPHCVPRFTPFFLNSTGGDSPPGGLWGGCRPPLRSSPTSFIAPPAISPHCVRSSSHFSKFTVRCILSKKHWNNPDGLMTGLDLSVIGGYQDWGWKEIRIWTLICWCFLTIGILLGSWWAYHELGWGGWWFWDPVENASFMPWVLCTGLAHSVLHAQLRLWTVFFSFATFLLSLLGTFFVRSGFLASVHSFASDSSRGIFFLIFLMGLVTLCSVVFYRFRKYSNEHTGAKDEETLEACNKDERSDRYPSLARVFHKSNMGGLWGDYGGGLSPPHFVRPPLRSLPTSLDTYGETSTHRRVTAPYSTRWASRAQSLATIQSLFALIVCTVVLCGTAAPVFFSLVFGRDISAGAPFFNGTVIPISAALFILCILAHLEDRSILNLFFLSLVFFFNTALALFIGGLAIVESLLFSIAFLLFHTLMRKKRTSMQLAHGGLCAFIAGIIFSNSYKSQTTQMLHIGDFLCIGKNTLFILRGIDQLYGPTFQSICANLFVQPNHFTYSTNDLIENNAGFTIFPEKRFYYLQTDSSTTKVAVQTNGLSDVYALIGTGNFETGWFTTVMKLPFIACIWIGFFVSSLGGFFSLYRLLKKPSLYWI